MLAFGTCITADPYIIVYRSTTCIYTCTCTYILVDVTLANHLKQVSLSEAKAGFSTRLSHTWTHVHTPPTHLMYMYIYMNVHVYTLYIAHTCIYIYTHKYIAHAQCIYTCTIDAWAFKGAAMGSSTVKSYNCALALGSLVCVQI